MSGTVYCFVLFCFVLFCSDNRHFLLDKLLRSPFAFRHTRRMGLQRSSWFSGLCSISIALSTPNRIIGHGLCTVPSDLGIKNQRLRLTMVINYVGLEYVTSLNSALSTRTSTRNLLGFFSRHFSATAWTTMTTTMAAKAQAPFLWVSKLSI